jgi:hypothetical protein
MTKSYSESTGIRAPLPAIALSRGVSGRRR